MNNNNNKILQKIILKYSRLEENYAEEKCAIFKCTSILDFISKIKNIILSEVNDLKKYSLLLCDLH